MADHALKRLERSFKRLILGGVERLFPRRVLPPPDWDARSWRVLYLRPDRIGDMILATPLIRAIAQSHRTIELDVLASPSNAPVLEGNPHVRRVLVYNKKRWQGLPKVARELRRGRYDVVIDGMVTAPSVTTMLLILSTRAPYRIGLGGLPNDAIFTLPVAPGDPDEPVLLTYARTATPFGVSLDDFDRRSELFLRPDELARAESRWTARAGSPRIVFNVSAVARDRHWPDERYVALLRHLRALAPEAAIILIGDPGDWPRVEAIGKDAGLAPENVSPVREMFALVAAADAVVTPDTSLTHTATATRTPMAALYRGNWLRHVPQGVPVVRIVSDGATLESLPAERAMAAMPDLLVLARERATRRAAVRPV